MHEPSPGEPALIRRSNDGGRTWSKKIVAFRFPAGPGLVTALYPVTSGDALHVFALRFNRMSTPEKLGSVDLLHTTSRDGGRTWSSTARIDFGHAYTGALNSAIALNDGRMLVALSYADEYVAERKDRYNRVVVVVSDDGGERWTIAQDDLDVPPGELYGHPGALEPVVVPLGDGRRLWMLIRTQRGLFYEAWSEDRGASWSKPRPTRFEAPNAPAALLRLSDGRLLMSWNDLARYPSRHDQMRQYLHVALSPDDGATWTPSVEIARREPGQLPDTQVSYPFLCENSDGSVLILYYRVGADPDQSWWTPSIEVLRLDPDWVQRATR